MTDEYLTIKIDIGEVWKKLEAAKKKDSEEVFFFASLNESKTETDNKPIYKGRNITVWHNKKKGSDGTAQEESVS